MAITSPTSNAEKMLSCTLDELVKMKRKQNKTVGGKTQKRIGRRRGTASGGLISRIPTTKKFGNNQNMQNKPQTHQWKRKESKQNNFAGGIGKRNSNNNSNKNINMHRNHLKNSKNNKGGMRVLNRHKLKGKSSNLVGAGTVNNIANKEWGRMDKKNINNMPSIKRMNINNNKKKKVFGSLRPNMKNSIIRTNKSQNTSLARVRNGANRGRVGKGGINIRKKHIRRIGENTGGNLVGRKQNIMRLKQSKIGRGDRTLNMNRNMMKLNKAKSMKSIRSLSPRFSSSNLSNIKIIASLDRLPPPLPAQANIPIAMPFSYRFQNNFDVQGREKNHIPATLNDRFA